ncbi:MAG: DUF4249 family protein [Bacteroidota bacterium]
MIKTFTILFILIVAVSCNTKFSVNGEYDETPIVHMLLDPNNDIHFLKLNKTFLGDGDANDFAMVPDSSYFEQVEATVKEKIEDNITNTWTLKDTIIENKDPGTFYHPEQKLYYFEAENLNEEATYLLHIDIDNGRHIVEGETNLVKGVSINLPTQNQQLNLADNNVAQNGYNTQSIVFSEGDGRIFKGQIRFEYREHRSGDIENKEILWTLGSKDASSITTSSPSFAANGEVFYEQVANRVEEDETVTRRTIKAFELILTAGSEDLNTYMLTNEPTSSLAQNKPTYSNVDGGLGIFSARTTVRQYKPFQPAGNPNVRAFSVNSTKELCEGQYTGFLKFCSDHTNDQSLEYNFACD